MLVSEILIIFNFKPSNFSNSLIKNILDTNIIKNFFVNVTETFYFDIRNINHFG